MPSLRNILHKREDITSDTSHPRPPPITITTPTSSSPPEFTFLRSDTFGQEVIAPPTHADDPPFSPTSLRSPTESLNSPTTPQAHPAAASNSSRATESPAQNRSPVRLRPAASAGSQTYYIAITGAVADLPQIDDDAVSDKQEREAAWEKRATVLAQHHPQFGSVGSPLQSEFDVSEWGGQSRSSSRSRAGDVQDDTNIQEAIRLHESGDLEKSTQMFGQLANPNGANNPLSQVLYGLALRHGWGCIKDEAQAVTYLSAAASNSAAVEAEALRAGIKKGGAAKGELVLAIFELANCFRNGWGVAKDPAAARQYYETAANLGDTDAMNEVAWCYLEGFGGKKEKFKAAKYYRLAEESGCPTVGNSWIWKEKYNPQ
ncbi:hypothetical protein N7451_004683 [Penicillium sp. IBT 35674x]|nr:hypothetical protein N7451_004683 [Penicillium sp. IBT 35674x]